jgi:hypothetical protein
MHGQWSVGVMLHRMPVLKYLVYTYYWYVYGYIYESLCVYKSGRLGYVAFMNALKCTA